MSNGNNNMSGKDFVIGALLGGIIGASAALLLAPKSGKELRQDLSEGYQTASKKTQEIAKNVSGHTDEFVGKVKDRASRVKEDMQRLKKEAQGVASQAKDRVQHAIDYVKDEAASTVDYDSTVDEVVNEKVAQIKGEVEEKLKEAKQ